MTKEKPLTAKKACKYLKLDSFYKVPLCTIEPIICTYWFCKAKGFKTRQLKCNLNCFRNCAIKNPEAEKVSDISKYYNQVINKLEEKLVHYRDKIPDNKFYGGLIAYREHEILKAFYETPGAFSDVFEVTGLIPFDIAFLEEKDIHIDKETNYFIALHSMKNVYRMKLHQIDNDDLVVYCTRNGFRYIENIIEDPEKDDLLISVKNGKSPSIESIKKSECHHIMKFLTIKNYDLIKWCKRNDFKRDILEFDHHNLFKKIITHIEETGLTGEIDARECYNLSYRPYMNAIYTLRSIYSHSRKFLRIAKFYKNIFPIIGKYIQWLPFWDNSLFILSELDEKEDFFIPKIDMEDCKEYPLHIGKKTLFPSLLMWSFVSKNWEEICSNRWVKGKIFEDKIETELMNRGVNILHKNLCLSPDDEIDFVCEADGRYYVIEAKNYGPNWDYNYLSSLSYKKRIDEMNSKISTASRRLFLIKEKRNIYGIPHGKKIYGMIITSFYEPNIIIPDGFIHITINQFNKIFGREREQPAWKQNPIFQVPEDIMQKIKEIHQGYVPPYSRKQTKPGSN
jgi:Holliday junction resolvase-like predicted endonuclease